MLREGACLELIKTWVCQLVRSEQDRQQHVKAREQRVKHL